ncbi:MAG: tetratricopeptide repeat protein [Nitrospirota bacterium]
MTLRPWLVAVVLVAAVFAAHGGALRGGFHYDDQPSIGGNPAVRSFQPLIYFTSSSAVSGDSSTTGYRPLTVLTFSVNYALHGLDPAGYLLVNVLLHALVAWMVFVTGRLVLGHDGWAAWAALLYAVHPLNAESVNYVVARSSLLAALGGVVAVWAFLRRLEGGGAWHTVVGVSALAFAVLSKESGVATIVPLAAAAAAALNPTGADPAARRWRALWPYAAALAAYVAVWGTLAGSATAPQARTAVYPAWAFAEMAGRSLLLWFWPWPLGLDHPLVFVTRFDWVTAGWVTALAAALAVLIIAYRRRAPAVSWCLAWALAGLAPLAPLPWITVKGLMQENRMAFSAVALAWLTAIAAGTAYGWACRALANRGPEWSERLGRGIVIALTATGVLLAVAVDRARSGVWSDNVRLWEEAAALSPDSVVAQTNLGSAYMKRGDDDSAAAAFERAIAIDPTNAFPYYNLGLLVYGRQRFDIAEPLFIKAASLSPGFAGPSRMLGLIALKQQRDEDSARYLRHAVTLDPRDAIAAAHLGLLAQRAGDEAAAEQWYRDAIASDPTQTVARNNLGTLYMQHRQWQEALEQFSASLAAAPENHDAALNRAVALDALGRRAEARQALEVLLPRLPSDHRFDSHRRSAALILNRPPP